MAADRQRFSVALAAKIRRKLHARLQGNATILAGLGMFGLIGWSVAVPTLLGALLGRWLDARYRGAHSWTLALLVAGLVIGCANAWHWVSREDRAMHERRDGE